MEQIYDVWLKNMERQRRNQVFYDEDYDLIMSLAQSAEFQQEISDFLKQYFTNETTGENIVKNLIDIVLNQKFLGYYTSVDTAKKLLENEEFWLCSTKHMNDYHEIDFGKKIVSEVVKSEDKDLKLYCESLIDRNQKSILEEYKKQIEDVKNNTYFMCLSETNMDNKYGKLSMWRRYGDDGIAFFFNKEVMGTISRGLSSGMSDKTFCGLMPVLYDIKGDKFRKVLKNTLEYIIKNREAILLQTAICPCVYLNQLFSCIMSGIVLLKHPAFEEENEYRFALSLSPDEDVSRFDYISLEDVAFDGENEKVIKYKFGGILRACNITWGDLLDHILIWSNGTDMIKCAERRKDITDILVNKGIERKDAEKKVRICVIPFNEKKDESATGETE